MIVVDTETTGTDWRTASLVSIGAVDFDNPENEFYGECRIFEGAHVHPEALAINGFSMDEVQDPTKRSDKDLVLAFMAWAADIADTTLAGENPSFDRDFMKMAAERYGLDWKFAHRTIDLHSVAYAHMLGRGAVPPSKNGHSGLNTDIILEYVGIPARKGTHDAQEDALCEAEALSRLIYGRGTIGDFEKFPLPAYLK